MKPVALFLVLLLAGCGSSVNPLARALQDQLGALSRPDTYGALLPDATPDLLARFDFPILYVDVPSLRDETFMRPAESNAGVETWIGAQGAALHLRDGILLGTRGYGFDLVAADRPALDVLHTQAARGTAYPVLYRHWGANEQLVTQRAECRAHLSDLGIEETCRFGSVLIHNMFEIAEGRVIASRQWAGDGLGQIHMRRLK